IYGAIIPECLTSPEMKESKAYKTYLGYAKKSSTTSAAGTVFRDTPVKTKSSRKEKVDVSHGKCIDLVSEVALAEKAQLKEVRKKSLRDFHKTHPSGSGMVAEKPPGVEKITPTVTSEGTGDKPRVPDVTEDDFTESECESWEQDEEYDYDNQEEEEVDQENKSKDDEIESDEDKGMDDTTDKFDDDVDARLKEPTQTDKEVVQGEGADVEMKNRFDIGKFNGRIPHGFSPREPTFQVTLDAISLTPCYPLFLITDDVPEVYMHQFWNSVYKHDDFYRFKINKKKRFKLTLEVFRDIFQIYLGHTGDITLLNDVVVDQMHQPWRTFAALINISLSGKTSGLDKLRLSRAQIIWARKDVLPSIHKDFFFSYDVYSSKRGQKDKDKDEDPSVGSNRGLKKRKTSKDAEPTTCQKKKDLMSGSSKGTKSQPKSSGKSIQSEEPVFEVADSDMPQDQEGNLGDNEDEPRKETASRFDWFKKPTPPQEPTDLDWNIDKTTQEGPTQNWLMTLVASTSTDKSLKDFDELMSTPIDFSGYILNGLKIENLTQEILLGPAFRLLKGTRSNYAELEYDFEECYKALSKKLDWENPKGGDYPFDLSKPFPLIKRRKRQRVPFKFFINNDLKYLQGGISTMTYTEEEEVNQENESKDDDIESDEDKGMDDTTNQFDDDTTQEQVVEDAYVAISTVTKKTKVSATSSSRSSELASKILKFSDIPHTDAEIVSPFDVPVQHEVPNTQTTTLLPIHVYVITTIPQSLQTFTPPPLVSTPTPPPTTEATNPPTTLPDFASVFRFNDRITALEKEVTEIKKDPLHTQVTSLVDEHLDTRLGETREEFINFLSESLTARIKEQVKYQLPQILPKEVSNFAPPVIEKLIKESRDEVTLAKVSSQPQSTYKAASTLTEFELKKILLDKMEKSESYLTSLEHRECYDGLKKSYALDKDFFYSYDVYSLKRGRKYKDKDEDPFAGSDRGLKKRKTSKDTEPTTDSDMPQDQEGNLGDNEDEPRKETASRRDWFKKPTPPQEPTDPDWNIVKTTQEGPTQNWLMNLAASNPTDKSLKDFDELMSTPINFSSFVLNGLKIENLTQEILLGPTFRLLKGTRSNYDELEYDFEECYKALLEKLDLENPEGGDYPFDLSKPLPLITRGNR
ncbi:hypothetical protein Tco_1196350, partial [Tanacetum coccineum]